MCGVAGVLAGPRAEPAGLDELKRMIAMIGHRGPDGYGFYRDGRIGLAHARLSIVGLAGGFQPIHNEERTLWITFNGEIFNHVELRRDLEARGHRFYTRTDTEVIVHAFEEYGPAAWAKLNGQFAIGLWDAVKRELWLVRDRLGILPLFYARSGDHLAFASEAKALFGGGRIEPRFDAARLAQVFTHWSVAPQGSVFAGVQSVPPATAIRIDSDLRLHEARYWEPDMAGDPALSRITLDEAADRLEEKLLDAIRLRLRADVPVGVYISGGLDSSVIAALARKLDTTQMHSFGVRFADNAFDETPQQRLVAGHVGTEHHDILCTAEDIQAALPDVIWHGESPLVRTAPAPLFLLSRLVRDSGIRVVLSGEGADEWLAGYDIFKEDKVRRFWARQPHSAARPKLLSRIHPYAATSGQKDSPLWQAFWKRGMTETDDPFYAHRIRWQNTGWTQRLLAPDVRSAANAQAFDDVVAAHLPAGWSRWSPLARTQWTEIAAFMSPYLLTSQGDRVAMANSIEVRYPFLDPEVDDLCAALPDRVKMLGLRDKLALRRVASRLLPAEIFHRPKRPYRAPMTTALFGAQAPAYVRDLLSEESLNRYGLVDAAGVAALAAKAHRTDGRMAGEREEMALVGVLTLQMLARNVLDELPGRASSLRARLDAAPIHILEEHLDSAAAA
ncbi:asparagine synthase (glutamine-hydrolyzing) (plasmid) [Azospirillum sp. TSH58]|uniref:asparagine synthase (glutamine-hydrolyzing) n=1 Tax=Azospirillum sp. TSH58 TaxID=664962 RepID=UPI000D5FE898|nr:asparagine synthase (glutamine-hydrolyzing) [Azospirillum sp. TSH58]AWJ86708.1 asparagine synthase (glutamine-hydrolyzing) [Azospirillum sp. TSH58]PWC67188.1 asparagine synthase [Azospirillum sp. TSH58]